MIRFATLGSAIGFTNLGSLVLTSTGAASASTDGRGTVGAGGLAGLGRLAAGTDCGTTYPGTDADAAGELTVGEIGSKGCGEFGDDIGK